MNDREQNNTKTETKLSKTTGIEKRNSGRGRGRPKKTDKTKSGRKTEKSKSKKTRKSSKTNGVIRDKQTEKRREKEETKQSSREKKCITNDTNESKKECNKIRKSTPRVRRRVISDEKYREAMRFLHKRLNETIDDNRIEQYKNMISKMEKTSLII